MKTQNQSKKWVFSGCYPFQNIEFINELSKLHDQPIFELEKDVVRIILPYCNNFDYSPSLEYCCGRVFLHIFNYGKRRDNLIGVSRCVRYETGVLLSMKELIFALESE